MIQVEVISHNYEKLFKEAVNNCLSDLQKVDSNEYFTLIDIKYSFYAEPDLGNLHWTALIVYDKGENQ